MASGAEIGPSTQLADCTVGRERRGRPPPSGATPTIGRRRPGRALGLPAARHQGCRRRGHRSVLHWRRSDDRPSSRLTQPLTAAGEDRADGAGPTRKLHLLTGRTHPALAAEIAANLGRRARATPTWSTSPTARSGPASPQSVRGADVFIIQSHGRTPGRSVNDSLVEQWIMIDAAKRASAKRITAVCPYYGYSRQDRKSKGREPITARMVSDFFADRRRRPDHLGGPALRADPGLLRRAGRPPDGGAAADRLPAAARPGRRLRHGGPRHRRTKVAEQAARHAGERGRRGRGLQAPAQGRRQPGARPSTSWATSRGACACSSTT